jgi:hypothetical protein
MRLRRLPRYATIVTAAIGSLALAAATTAAASASAGGSRSAQSCTSVGALCWTRVDGVAIPRVGPLPKGAPPIAGTVTVDLAKEFPHSKAVRAIPDGTLEGYMWCLYNAPKSCIGEDRGWPDDESPDEDPSTYSTLNWIADPPSDKPVWATMWNDIPGQGNSFEMQVVGLYNEQSQEMAEDPQDGWCQQVWQYQGQQILAQCQQDGDYYQTHDLQQSNDVDIYNTRTDADSYVDCNCENEEIIEGSPVEWHSWSLWEIEDSDTSAVTLSPWYAKAIAADARAPRKDLTRAG